MALHVFLVLIISSHDELWGLPRRVFTLLSAARTLRGDLRLLVANTSDVQGEILLYDGCKSSTAPAQNGLYVVAACCKITNTVGNTPIWGEKYKRGSFRKYKWCTRRNPSLHWLPEKWRNWGKGVRGPQWADETCQIGSKWQNLMFIHDWFQFRWAFWCRIFFWLRTRPPKLKYCFFGGSFSRLTSQSQAGTLSRANDLL